MLESGQTRLEEGVYMEDEEGKCYLGPAKLNEFPKDGSISFEHRQRHKWLLKNIAPESSASHVTCDDYGFVHGQKGVIARLRIINHH